MDAMAPIATVAHVIQLSVAPVFLLGGVGAMLAVLTNRLARIVDRARVLEAELPGAAPGRVDTLTKGLRRMAARARLTSWAISFCIGCALLISSVIVALFVGSSINWNLSTVIASLFVSSILSLICGLLCFLREIYLSTRYLRIGAPDPEHSTPGAKVVATQTGQPPA